MQTLLILFTTILSVSVAFPNTGQRGYGYGVNGGFEQPTTQSSGLAHSIISKFFGSQKKPENLHNHTPEGDLGSDGHRQHNGQLNHFYGEGSNQRLGFHHGHQSASYNGNSDYHHHHHHHHDYGHHSHDNHHGHYD